MTAPLKRRRRPLPSADAVGGNDDLLTEILIHLPAKSLCRFKSISKRWCCLISHLDFSLLRMPNSVSGLVLLIDSRPKSPLFKYLHLSGKRTRSAPFKSLTFVDDPLGIKIIHSCNGLLLCSSTGYCDDLPENNYYIYNPTTKQFATITLPCYVAKRTVRALNLAFDPSRTPHYKLVLVCSHGASSYQIEIYSSETRSWRPSGVPFAATFCLGFRNGVFLNGAIHWLSCWSETSFRFDVDRERVLTIPMPPIQDGRDERTIRYFGESRGHLHLICGYQYSSPFEVLEMESDYSKWFVKYSVDLDAIKTTFPKRAPFPYLSEFSVLHLVRGEMEEESYLVLHIPGMLISYNFKEKTSKILCKLVLRRRDELVLHYNGWLHAHQYTETLIRI